MATTIRSWAWLTLAAAALTGCASQTIQSPTTYANYHDGLRVEIAKQILAGPYASAPNRTRADFADCASDFAVSKLDPDTLAKLDAYASGQTKMTFAEYQAIDAKGTAETGGPLRYADLDRLAETCPDKIADFKRYFGPGFNGL